MSLALGIATGGVGSPVDVAPAIELVERAEALGCHSVWLPEGHFQPGATPSPLLWLAAFAARTRRIRLATTSILVSIHHPLRVAAEVATLDRLSGGRVLLGLGRGFRPEVFRAFGVAAADKRDRFDEALDVMLRAWAGEAPPAHAEPFADVDGALPEALAAPCGLAPVQRPHPPLVVAAFGPKGLRQAARRGLPYLASPLETLPTLEANYALWREHRCGAPDPRAPAVPVMRTVFVAGAPAEAERVREALARHADRLRSARARVPRALARAAEGALEERVLVGTSPEVADRLAEYRERLGLDLLVARVEVPATTPAERLASLTRLAHLATQA